jgi:T-complex protein 1 subunit theta
MAMLVVMEVESAKIVVFASGFEASTTESKGMVVMKSVDDLKNYNKTEERKMEDIVAGIAIL